MVHSPATLVPTAYRALPSSFRVLLVGSLAVLVALMCASALDLAPGVTAWTRAELTFAAAFSAVGTLLSIRGTTGRTRRVRSWIAVAVSLWLVSELIRDVEVAAGMDRVPGLSDIPFAGVLVCAGLAYVAALRGQVRPGEEAAVYLDATVVFLACTSFTLTLFGDIAARSPSGAIDLAYAIFFIATTGATLLLDLAVRAERKPHGAYVVLVGLVLLGVGFCLRLVAPGVGLHEIGPPSHFLAIGVVVVMLGTITWTDTVDQDAGYVRFADRLRSRLPLAAVALTPVLLVVHVVRGLAGPIGLANVVAIGLLLAIVSVRQSVLLRDRESAIQRERRLSGELSTAEAKYRSLVERQPGVVYLAEFGETGRWHYVSPQIERMLGFPAQQWLEDSTLWARQLHPDDRPRILGVGPGDDAAATAGPRTSEYRLRAADGREVWILEDESVTRLGTDGEPTLVQGVMVDITERKRVEEALRASEEQTRMIIETASHAFIGMDTDGRVIDWNQRAADTFGWQRSETLGRLLADLIIPEPQRPLHAAGLRRFLETGEGPLLSKRIEVSALHRDGREFPVELTVWPVVTGSSVRFNALIDDITARKQLEDQLRHQALHDALTGLANRVLFSDRVQHALERTDGDPDLPITVLFLDLDDFKTINDSLGHAVGDQLLTAVAERLTSVLRTDDTGARLGGDEFAILLEDAPARDAATTATRILEELARPFELKDKVVSTTASMGVTISGPHGSSPEELLRNADLAMYLAKARGKNRHELYVPGMHEQALRRLDLKAALEHAIAAGELEVHYQPIVGLSDGAVTGVEALLRWRAPDGQYVPLRELIPIAEETGLIIPIGRFVLDRACRDVRAWQEELGVGADQLDLAVNVSVVQLEHGTLVHDVERALQASGLQAESLVLEITESSLTNDSLDTARTLRDLRGRGVRLALDDFGTGYSSLERLRRFAVDIVKIDRSFVTAITRDREGVLVQSIIDLGRSLGMRVVAEGMETQAQVVALRARGAAFGQGYYFSKPVPAAAIGPILAVGRLPLTSRRLRPRVVRGA
ncbi:MAG: EAL domain-containing protein [Chloroflexota bacterium]|nr:EAL domain-containing protein [Chloroflexota bacterium]